MNHPYYPFDGDKSAVRFDFDSVNSRTGRIIKKRIEYSPTKNGLLYNMALGDLLSTGATDIFSRSNNDDRDQVLATVVQTLIMFLSRYPERAVLFTGSTESRTRLYRLAIARELDNATTLFTIYGIRPDQELEPFQPNSQYIAFIIKSK